MSVASITKQLPKKPRWTHVTVTHSISPSVPKISSIKTQQASQKKSGLNGEKQKQNINNAPKPAPPLAQPPWCPIRTLMPPRPPSSRPQDSASSCLGRTPAPTIKSVVANTSCRGSEVKKKEEKMEKNRSSEMKFGIWIGDMGTTTNLFVGIYWGYHEDKGKRS